MNDNLPSFAEMFQELIEEGSAVTIAYSHRLTGYKDVSYTVFRVESVNGCASPAAFRGRLRGLTTEPLRRLTEIARTCSGADVADYLQGIADECEDLAYLVCDDEQVFDEPEHGAREAHPFKRFRSTKLQGDLGDVVSWNVKSIQRQASDFAQTWLAVIAETQQRIAFLSSHAGVGSLTGGSAEFVSADRLRGLQASGPEQHDLTRLIRLLEELNIAYASRMYFASAMLLRAIVDHVPPIFGKSTFAEVSGTHGSRSFKDSMVHLDRSLRKIADQHLHTPIRTKEILPTAHQVNFSQDLDVLLGEICRVRKTPNNGLLSTRLSRASEACRSGRNDEH